VSGDPAKAQALATLYGVPAKSVYNYENYESMRENPDINGVYVVLPDSLHAEYTIRAAQAGKHVLCEKPMATNPQECEKMIAACKTADRKMMIAYRIQYEPYNRIVQGLALSDWFLKLRRIEKLSRKMH
jgi:predicted dehydrogenase